MNDDFKGFDLGDFPTDVVLQSDVLMAAAAAKHIRTMREKDHEIALIRKNDPLAAFYFCTKYVVTFDEEKERKRKFPDFPYLRDIVFPKIHAPGHRLWEKSQRSLITISFCAEFFWSWLCTDSFMAWMTSRRDTSIDDGGRGASWKSLFGKMKFFYDEMYRKNPWLIEALLGRLIPSDRLFSDLKLLNPMNGNLIAGEAPKAGAPTGEGYTKALVDECALVPMMHLIHGNVVLACPNGVHYVSYPFGMNNTFAEIRHTPGHRGFEIVEIDYHMNPEHDAEWFKDKSSNLTVSDIARRFGRSYLLSTEGKVFKKFSRDLNVMRGHKPNFDNMEIWWDFGSVDATSVGFVEVTMIETDGKILPAVIVWKWIEKSDTNVKEVSELVHNTLIDFGFGRSRERYTDMTEAEKKGWHEKTWRIRCVGDPQINTTMIDSGITLKERYKAMGFSIDGADPHESAAVYDGIDDWLENGRFFVDDERAIPALTSMERWEWPKDRMGNVIPGSHQPKHDENSHAGKAIEYGMTRFFVSKKREEKSRVHISVMSAQDVYGNIQ